MAVPAVFPVITPVVVLAIAIVTLLLLHVPPAVASVKTVASPEQTLLVPSIIVGTGLTVSVDTVMQPGPAAIGIV